MTVPPGLVVDASVAAKWHLTDESLIDRASVLKARFDAGRTKLAAPSFIRYEVAQTLERAERDGRIGPGMAASEFATFLSFGVHEQVDSDELILSARRLARWTGASVYDALYVVHAESIQFEVVTADEQLARQMSGYGVPVHLLSELDLS